MTTRDARTMLGVAIDALEYGFSVVPPKEDGTKRPDGPWANYQQRLPTEDEIRSWYSNGRHGIGVVCGAVSGNLEMLEFEGRAIEENISNEFVELATAAGLRPLVERINAGYCETTPTGGLHLLYRVEGVVAGNTKLARRPSTDVELAAWKAEQQAEIDGLEDTDLRAKRQQALDLIVRGDQVPQVLIETRGEGGYVVTAPSHGTIHPSGREWALLRGGFHEVATITADERDELHRVARSLDRMPAPTPTEPTVAPSPVLHADVGQRPGDTYNTQPNAATVTLQLLERHGWQRVFDRSHGDHQDVHLRRPGKSIGTSAVLHMDAGTLVVFSTSTRFDAEQAYSPFAVLTELEHGGDYKAAARALRPAGAQIIDITNLITAPTNIDPATGEITQPTHHLPDELWQARPIFAHILQAARSRMVAPDAVLGAVLTRVAAITPHTVELPAIIGTPVGLTFYAGIVGPPEAGKSAAAAVAAELLPAPSHILDRLPVGSGEGMVEILFDYREEPDPETGKKKKVKRQVNYAAIFHIDEGAVLAELSGRQGSTLLPTIRTAWTHGTLGNANASIEKRRILDGRNYVYGITFGIQPEYAGPILADTAAGTPQRFVWFNATDPTAIEQTPEWPGELDWQPPDTLQLEPHIVSRGGWRRHQLHVDPQIRAEVVAHRHAVRTEQITTTDADAHRKLVQLKIAALLALLDGRLELTPDDWHLANIIDTTSRTVRQRVQNTLTALDQRREQAVLERHARRELHVESSKEARAVTSAAKSIGNIVHRHAEQEAHVEQNCNRRCLSRAIAGKHRPVFDDALADAEKNNWITPDSDGWKPGTSRPA